MLTLAGAAVGVGLVALANRVITFPEGLTLYHVSLKWMSELESYDMWSPS